MTDQHIIQISDTHITLPGGSMLALDACREFTPNRAFWNVWKRFKLDVKRCGVFVRLDEGQYRGYVHEASEGFGYSKSDIHQYLVSKAQEKADTAPCEPAIIDYAELTKSVKVGCLCHAQYEIVVTVCSNGTYQLRLKCFQCDRRTPNAIAWDRFPSASVVEAIAYRLQQIDEQPAEHGILDELRNIDSFV